MWLAKHSGKLLPVGENAKSRVFKQTLTLLVDNLTCLGDGMIGGGISARMRICTDEILLSGVSLDILKYDPGSVELPTLGLWFRGYLETFVLYTWSVSGLASAAEGFAEERFYSHAVDT